jgi:hypothetical protein
MGYSKTEICNSALLLLGDLTINSINDNSRQAEVCRLVYDRTRKYVLSEHLWNCATKRAVLAQLTDSPNHEYSYAYSLPVDCLRVVSIGEDYDWKLRDYYTIEQNTILSNTDIDVSSLNIKYIADVGEEYFDSLFAEVFIYQLAVNLCVPLTADTASRNNLIQILTQQILPKAKFSNAISKFPRRRQTHSDWVNARWDDSNGFIPSLDTSIGT